MTTRKSVEITSWQSHNMIILDGSVVLNNERAATLQYSGLRQ